MADPVKRTTKRLGFVTRIEPEGFGVVTEAETDLQGFFTMQGSGADFDVISKWQKTHEAIEFESVDVGSRAFEVKKFLTR